jgi:hypothetical protein
MVDFTWGLEEVIQAASSAGNLSADTLHEIILCSFIKAGLSIYGASRAQEVEVENLIETIPAPYRGLINGKLYLSALRFIRSFNKFLHESRQAVILREANLHYILHFLESRVGKVGAVLVLDCASIPEFVTIASKFSALRRNVTIFEEVFVNPLGVTRFLTGQLESFNREASLRQYAQLLKERLKANFFVKSSTIDVIAHQRGLTLGSFLKSIEMQRLFDQLNRFVRQSSVLVTSDHGYDVVADEYGLYVTHGYRKECPLSFSRLALFLVVD